MSILKFLRQEKGFTFLEIVVTATFAGIAFVSIIQIFIVINNLSRQSRNLSAATQVAKDKVEEYRSTDFNAIPTPTEDFTADLPGNLGNPKSAIASIDTSVTGIKKVDIVITYQEGNAPKRIRMHTYIAQSGLNR